MAATTATRAARCNSADDGDGVSTDRWKFGPPDEGAMLPWYEGAYTHAFVALHPFFAIEGLDPTHCNHGPLVLTRNETNTGIDIVQWMNEALESQASGKELNAEAVNAAAKRFGSPLGWRALCDRAGFADHCALDRALRTQIGGLKAQFEDKPGAARLERYCRENHLFPPTAGYFQPVMQQALAELFQRAGIDPLWVAEEFGDDEILQPLSAMRGDEPWDSADGMPHYGVRRLFAPDRSLFAWVHWDSFFTVILGTEMRLRDLNLASLFEGFWCSEETHVYWLNQPCLPLVQ